MAIFDSNESKELALDDLIKIYKSNGVTRIVFKNLSPNDNSKNQPYMGGHLSDLGFLPTHEISESLSSSSKTEDPKRKIKYTAKLNFSWISADGKLFPAVHTKLIYYPQYGSNGEVRLSGFLKGCSFDPGGWMDPYKKGRSGGRILILGIKSTGEIIAWLATPISRIAKEIITFSSVQLSGVFNEIKLNAFTQKGSAKDILIAELRRIHQKKWIKGKRLKSNGVEIPYNATSAGGYTLEAELGITPNGFSLPDFMGYELKQFKVDKCVLIDSPIITLMTPEPDGGFYKKHKIEKFMRTYGYPNKSIADRLDFTGGHYAGKVCLKSGLRLETVGYDSINNTITNAGGCIAILDRKGNAAASWSFSKIMKHWTRKHAKAVYIPSNLAKNKKVRSYSYCKNIRLFAGGSFIKLLQAINNGDVYYDPAIHLDNISSTPKAKKRNQFRMKSKQLVTLYNSIENIDVTTY